MQKLLIAMTLTGLLAARMPAMAADDFDWEAAAQSALAEAQATTARPIHRGFFHHLAENWQKNVVAPLRQFHDEQENFKHPVPVIEGPLTLWSDWTWQENDGVVEVWGRINNRTQFGYHYVEARFEVMDKDGNQLGIALANTTHLDADGTWRFHALLLGAYGAQKVAPFTPSGN